MGDDLHVQGLTQFGENATQIDGLENSFETHGKFVFHKVTAGSSYLANIFCDNGLTVSLVQVLHGGVNADFQVGVGGRFDIVYPFNECADRIGRYFVGVMGLFNVREDLRSHAKREGGENMHLQSTERCR